MNKYVSILSGGDHKSLGASSELVSIIQSQCEFDELFKFLSNPDPLVQMRASDAVEKISRQFPEFLNPHKSQIISLTKMAIAKELKWHLAQMIPRLRLNENELGWLWRTLRTWASDKKESRIVRVNSVQALHDLLLQCNELESDFRLLLAEIDGENIPSLKARIRKLKFGR